MHNTWLRKTIRRVIIWILAKTCPKAELIVRDVMKKALMREPRSVASVMRFQFHDCFVNVRTSNLILFSIFNLILLLLFCEGVWWFYVAWWYTNDAGGEIGPLKYKFAEIVWSCRSSEGSAREGLPRSGFLCWHHNYGI